MVMESLEKKLKRIEWLAGKGKTKELEKIRSESMENDNAIYALATQRLGYPTSDNDLFFQQGLAELNRQGYFDVGFDSEPDYSGFLKEVSVYSDMPIGKDKTDKDIAFWPNKKRELLETYFSRSFGKENGKVHLGQKSDYVIGRIFFGIYNYAQKKLKKIAK